MKVSQVFHVIDSHTAGEPTRVLMGEAVPPLKGNDMEQRRKYFQKNYDYIRTTLTQEPRKFIGVAAILMPPANPKADYGLLYCDHNGYVYMCVHGTIGVLTTLVELGIVKKAVAKKGLVFDTPSGLIHTRARMSSGKTSVLVRNVPSYFMKEARARLGEGRKEISASLAYCGNVFAYVNAKDLGVTIEPKNLRKLLSVARELLPQFGKINGVSIYEDLPKYSRNIMIAENDLFDRSPCGSGTSGRMALLYHESKLSPGDTFVNKSILGTTFLGRIVRAGTFEGRNGIIPEVEGTAYLTGTADLMVSEKDELATGFLLA
jgi:proline racemase